MPTQQAPPMTRTDIVKICRATTNPVRLMLMLAWKTASRWSDIARLQKKSFLQITPEEIIIFFGRETKTSRQDPFRPDLYAVIRGDGTRTMAGQLQALCAGKRASDVLFHTPTDEAREILMPFGYTAHSIKRGAILHLLKTFPEGDPRISLIALLGKQAPHYPVLGSITVRYAGEQIEMARHLGTGLLTSML